MTKYHLQDQFLNFFFNLPETKTFYLTGGTALDRQYYHHRQSDDLDLFSNQSGTNLTPVIEAVEVFARKNQWKTEHRVASSQFQQYIFRAPDQETLKVDMVVDVPIHFGELTLMGTIPVDSLLNISTNKIATLFSRTESKDYIDLYWILTHESFELSDLLKKAKQKDLGLDELYLAEACRHVVNISTFPETNPFVERSSIENFYMDLAKRVLELAKPK